MFQINLCSNYNPTIKLSPVVVLQVLDHYKRRNEDQPRVVGALLGKTTNDIIKITSCFPIITKNETEDDILIDNEYLKSVKHLHSLTSPSLSIVGLYSTSSSITYTTSVLCTVFKEYVPNPMLLLVDVTLCHNSLAVRLYASLETVRVESKEILAKYKNLDFSYDGCPVENEAVANMIHLLQENKFSKFVLNIGNETDQLFTSLERLYNIVNQVSDYVDKTVSGTVPMKPEIGREVARIISLIESNNSASIKNYKDTSIQEMLMVMYLSSLTRAHIAMSDKMMTNRNQ